MAQAQLLSLSSQESQNEAVQKPDGPPVNARSRKRKSPQVATTTKQPRQTSTHSATSAASPTAPCPNIDLINDILFFDLYFDMAIAPSLAACITPVIVPAATSTAAPVNTALVNLYRTLFKHQLFRSFILRLNSSEASANTHMLLCNAFVEASLSLGLQFT